MLAFLQLLFQNVHLIRAHHTASGKLMFTFSSWGANTQGVTEGKAAIIQIQLLLNTPLIDICRAATTDQPSPLHSDGSARSARRPPPGGFGLANTSFSRWIKCKQILNCLDQDLIKTMRKGFKNFERVSKLSKRCGKIKILEVELFLNILFLKFGQLPLPGSC